MKIDFTFGITTYADETQRDFSWRERIRMICEHIRRQNIPNYEIIIAGGPFVSKGRHADELHVKKISKNGHWINDIVHIPFDEDATPEIPLVSPEGKNVDEFYSTNSIKTNSWVSRKKNLIVQKAKYPNIVIMHDYCALMKDWYKGQLRYVKEKGNDWDLQMNAIEDIWGTRTRDWVAWDHPVYKQRKLMPYDDYTETAMRHAYISGPYITGKTEYFRKNPFPEECVWGSCDDLNWSLSLRDEWNYVMNPYSTVRFIKPKYI